MAVSSATDVFADQIPATAGNKLAIGVPSAAREIRAGLPMRWNENKLKKNG
jgi:hypothetical protein